MELHRAPSPVNVPEDKKYTDQDSWSYTIDDGMGWVINAEDGILCPVISITAKLPDGSDFEFGRAPGLVPLLAEMFIKGQLRNLQRKRVELLTHLYSKRNGETYSAYYKKLLDLYVKDTLKARESIVQSFGALDPSAEAEFDHAWELGDGSGDWVRVFATKEGYKIEVGPLKYEDDKDKISPVLFEREVSNDESLSSVFLLDVLNSTKKIHRDSWASMQNLVNEAKEKVERAKGHLKDAEVDSDVREFLGNYL